MPQGRAHSLLCVAGKSSEYCQGCELNAKDAEIARLIKVADKATQGMQSELARVNKYIEALKRERDELQCDYDSVGERLDERSEQLARANERIEKLEKQLDEEIELSKQRANNFNRMADKVEKLEARIAVSAMKLTY